ncbi:hypothetical protein, partial [Streptomyces sp. NPDC057557]|uniref:hypothetical protein n=1 Tax=Streptomyces sp. NPDC057557 TaxID=3346167 RepID=UPI0036BAA319
MTVLVLGEVMRRLEDVCTDLKDDFQELGLRLDSKVSLERYQLEQVARDDALKLLVERVRGIEEAREQAAQNRRDEDRRVPDRRAADRRLPVGPGRIADRDDAYAGSPHGSAEHTASSGPGPSRSDSRRACWSPVHLRW